MRQEVIADPEPGHGRQVTADVAVRHRRRQPGRGPGRELLAGDDGTLEQVQRLVEIHVVVPALDRLDQLITMLGEVLDVEPRNHTDQQARKMHVAAERAAEKGNREHYQRHLGTPALSVERE